MRFFQDKRGFSLVELMIAVLIMTIGLAGVAAMQTMAMKGIFTSSSNSSGATIAQSWTEWFSALANQADADPVQDPVTKLWSRVNLAVLMSLDTNPDDTMAVYKQGKTPPVPFTEYEMGSSIEDIVDFFNEPKSVVYVDETTGTVSFQRLGGGLFTAADLPPAAPAGSRLLLRIAANVPVVNTATVEVSLPYTNAFTTNKGATLRFVVSSNM